MKQKITVLIITLLLLVCSLPCSANPKNSFNDPDLWRGGEFTDDGIFVSNPVDFSQEEGIYHHLSLTSDINIKENTMYTLSFEITGSDDSLVPISAKASFSYELNDILMTISGISSQTHNVSIPFASGSSGNFGLSFYFLGESEESTFILKNIILTENSYKPIEMNVFGKTNLYIPETGYISYHYSAVTKDLDNTQLSLIDGKIQVEGELPEGVSFNEESFVITVTAEACAGDSFSLKATPSDGSDLSSIPLTINLTKNFISNGDFENQNDDTWDYSYATVENEGENHFASVYTNIVDTELYRGSLTTNYNYYLTEGVLYSLRAKVKSTDEFMANTVSVSNSLDDGTLSFNITGIGTGHWQDIVCGFIPEASGIYDISLNFISGDSRPVFVDDVSFSADILSPSSILFSLPKHISIPKNDYLYMPIKMQTVNQLNITEQDTQSAKIFPDDTGVSITKNTIIVSSWAKEGIYRIEATSSLGAKGIYNIEINNTSVGGGDFEHSASENYWITAFPSEFTINSVYNDTKPKEGSYFGILNMNGNVSALLSSSAARYDKETGYVFEADMFKNYSDIDTVVTVLITGADNSSFEESIVVGQFSLSSEYTSISKVFTPSQSLTGRLMIAFNTPEEHDSQVILLDNIKIKPAEVTAQGVFIYGSPFVERMVSGTYSFDSNFNGTDSSTFRWLVSSEKNGAFLPIPGETSDELSVTSNLNGKYIKFEVTPVSLEGPVSGASVTSPAIQIGIQLPDYSTFVPENEPEISEPEDYDPNNDSEEKPTDIYLKPVDLYYFERFADSFYYFDMANHWAEYDVKLMSAAGITNGRNDNLFFPNEYVTRAEFSAFLIRSFNLAPIYYTDIFSDVKAWQWYSGTVETVCKYNLANGLGDKLFGPELPLTREQMAVMIMRAYKKSGAKIPQNTGKTTFLDDSDISLWAKEDVTNAVSLGILLGNDDNSFAPSRNATRAETLTALKRMLITIYQNVPQTQNNDI